MELRWPGAYGQVKKRRRSEGGAAPRSKRLAVDLGSTGIRAGPGGYEISRRPLPLPLPPWPEPPSTRVSRGRFDHHADHEVVAMAIAPLTDIALVLCVASEPRPAHAALPPGLCCGRFDFDLVADALAPFTDATRVFYVALDPRPTHAAPRGANYILLCNFSNCPKRLQILVLDPFDPFGRIQLTLHMGSETRPGSPAAWEGFSDPSVVELVGEHALWAALHQGLNCSNRIMYRWRVLAILCHGDWIGHIYSGSLFMYADHRGGAYSKNSSRNIYAAVGVFVLDHLFREAWAVNLLKCKRSSIIFLMYSTAISAFVENVLC